jgi:hypothetical protein
MLKKTESVRPLGHLKARELSIDEANTVTGGSRIPGASCGSTSITGDIQITERFISGTDGGSD